MSQPPVSLLISPDLRRRLQQRYEEALRLAQQPVADRGLVHTLLAECLAADPGNILYLDALVANLRSWKRPSRSWLAGWLGRMRKRYGKATSGAAALHSEASGDASSPTNHTSPSADYELLRGAAESLFTRLDDPVMLRRLAEAAGDCGFDQVELRYWQLAVVCAPHDGDLLGGLARALTWQGRFTDAAAAWQRVFALASQGTALPDSTIAEARVALADLEPEADERFVEAERSLQDTGAAEGTSLDLIEARERLQLERSEHRLRAARRRAEHDQHPRAAALALQLETEHNRLEIDIFHLRAERLPNNADVRIELARRLKRARNFSGAVQRLEEARHIRGDDAELLVELGECWQHLRQFAKALDLYRDAIAAGPADPHALLARYRAAVLSAAMGQPEEARRYLGEVVAVDPGYKDARERLDNLPPK